jgi:hypothetical protein
MPTRSAFEYAVIRVVPRVERGECINMGVVLFCRQQRYLAAQMQPDLSRLHAFAPQLDLEPIQVQLNHIPLVCGGGGVAGPIGLLPAQERFRWLTAPRSTIIQPSPVHVGLCTDPAAALARLYTLMVA